MVWLVITGHHAHHRHCDMTFLSPEKTVPPSEDADAEATRACEQAQRADKSAEEARNRAQLARNSMRMFVARNNEADPTTAFAFLREVEPPFVPEGWEKMTVSALQRGVASAVITLPALPYAAVWTPDDRKIAIASFDHRGARR